MNNCHIVLFAFFFFLQVLEVRSAISIEYLDSIVSNGSDTPANIQKKFVFNYNDSSQISKRIEYHRKSGNLTWNEEETLLYFYNKKGYLIKTQQYQEGKLWCEVLYSYDKKGNLILLHSINKQVNTNSHLHLPLYIIKYKKDKLISYSKSLSEGKGYRLVEKRRMNYDSMGNMIGYEKFIPIDENAIYQIKHLYNDYLWKASKIEEYKKDCVMDSFGNPKIITCLNKNYCQTYCYYYDGKESSLAETTNNLYCLPHEVMFPFYNGVILGNVRFANRISSMVIQPNDTEPNSYKYEFFYSARISNK